ncbi:MAG: hypothetical protein IAF94_15310 [Pirellulaceae bacterium]|nr:hypothetical protein [Pirellulaceae bacterium]
MRLPIYYVGTPAEVEHHARPLASDFDVRIAPPEELLRHAQPGDVCIFFNEFFPRFREVNHELVRRQCPSLYALDGILEWRCSWEFPPGISCLWSMRPVLSHKIACIGSSQARTLESWGNTGKCEVVGLPRMDGLLSRQPRQRDPSEPFTILVLTAKSAGFNEEQLQRTTQSLVDLKSWLDRNPTIRGTPLRAVWRITQGLETAVGIENSLRDTTGQDLAAALASTDAVITTASTSMLEGMLQGVPLALLDYHNCPHYVPAAWRITAAAHWDQVLPELLDPSPAKMAYQKSILQDALECSSPALPRLTQLIEGMHTLATKRIAAGLELSFPRRILPSPAGESLAHEISLDHALLFPANPAFAQKDFSRLQAELGDVRALNATVCAKLHAEKTDLAARLQESQALAEETRRRLDALQQEADLLRARERKSLRARLERLQGKAARLARSILRRESPTPANRRVA